jgi:lysophospholipase L1-like esterase
MTFNENSTILFQGDSITDSGRSREDDAVNQGLGGGYANAVAAELLAVEPEKQYKILNRGISGNRIVDVYARWKSDGLNLKPDVLSMLIGINDIWHEFGSQNGVEADRFDQFYRMVLDWTRRELPSTQLIICEPFALPCGAVTAEWLPVISERREIVAKIAADYGTVFVPFQNVFDEAMMKAPAHYWAPDGVHPSIAGHKIMADAWLKSVNES